MNSLLFEFFLGLLTVVHSTPLTSITQSPKSEDDVLREAVTDGFLVDHNLLPALTTGAPKRTTTPQGTTMQPLDVDEIEGSAVENADNFTFPHSAAQLFDERRSEHDKSTTGSILSVQTTTSTADSDSSPSAVFLTQSPRSSLSTSLKLSEDRTTSSRAQSTDSTVSRPYNLSTPSDTGSGDGENNGQYHTASIEQIAAWSKTLPTAVPVRPESPAISHENEGSESGSGILEKVTVKKVQAGRMSPIDNDPSYVSAAPLVETTLPKGHVTPDWIIILAFIVGLAALVLVCVAIATREKWNGPDQLNKTEITCHSVNQQRAVEMKSFLHKERPRENRKAAEYTVIPLEDLPDSFSSQ